MTRSVETAAFRKPRQANEGRVYGETEPVVGLHVKTPSTSGATRVDFS